MEAETDGEADPEAEAEAEADGVTDAAPDGDGDDAVPSVPAPAPRPRLLRHDRRPPRPTRRTAGSTRAPARPIRGRPRHRPRRGPGVGGGDGYDGSPRPPRHRLLQERSPQERSPREPSPRPPPPLRRAPLRRPQEPFPQPPSSSPAPRPPAPTADAGRRVPAVTPCRAGPAAPRARSPRDGVPVAVAVQRRRTHVEPFGQRPVAQPGPLLQLPQQLGELARRHRSPTLHVPSPRSRDGIFPQVKPTVGVPVSLIARRSWRPGRIPSQALVIEAHRFNSPSRKRTSSCVSAAPATCSPSPP